LPLLARCSVAAAPQRVICLINQCVEELAFLGVKPIAVGEFWNYNIALHPQNFGEAAKTIQQVPGRDTTDWEAVAALKPDLVIAYGEEDRAALGGIAPMYSLEGDDNSIDDFVYNVRTLGRVFGIAEQTEAKITRALDRLNAYAERSPKNKSLFITGIDEGSTFYAYSTNEWWPCSLINQVALCGYPPGEGGSITVEGLLGIDPDVIVIEEYDPQNGVDAAKVRAIEASNPLWQELKAYKANRIFVVPRTEARITSIQSLGFVLDTLMPLIYPEVFPQPLTDEQVQEIVGNTAQAATGFPVTISDGEGRELTFEQPPQRVVCLLNRCAQELALIGVKLVGLGAPYTFNVAKDEVNFGAAANDIAQVTQDPEIDWEQVAALRPDLIIGEATHVAAAQDIAPLYALSFDNERETSVEAITSDLRAYGRIFGVADKIEARIQAITNRVAAYAALSPKNKSVLVVFFSEDGKTVWMPPNCGIFLSQATLCGNPGSDEWIEGTMETLLSFDPDVLVVEEYLPPQEQALVASLSSSDPLWQELKAVKNNAVHVVPVSQARTNTIRAAELTMDALMPLIYPEVFPQPLTDEQVQEIVAQ
jgi:iron complex transport system substrate-binding protein